MVIRSDQTSTLTFILSSAKLSIPKIFVFLELLGSKKWLDHKLGNKEKHDQIELFFDKLHQARHVTFGLVNQRVQNLSYDELRGCEHSSLEQMSTHHIS